jgi:hypothetical protein
VPALGAWAAGVAVKGSTHRSHAAPASGAGWRGRAASSESATVAERPGWRPVQAAADAARSATVASMDASPQVG